MKLKTIESEGLAHYSYFLSDEGEAAVIDPRRDALIYVQIAKKECTQIRHILETHRNEDYVTGSCELQQMTNARIAHSKELPFEYGEHNLADGDILQVGNLQIKAIHTPGHTDESVCYVVNESGFSDESLMIFTGDTLFAGGIGRTDLYGQEKHREQATKLRRSIVNKLLPLGDQATIFPAHGSGSVCGGDISDRAFSTLGYERKNNPWLQLDEQAFIKRAVSEKMTTPPYFKQMEKINMSGAPLLSSLPVPQILNVEEFERLMREPNNTIIDTREPGAFAGSHIPQSLNIPLKRLSAYSGWVLKDERILLVHENPKDLEKASRSLWRTGFDNVLGCLCSGIDSWRSLGKPIESLGVLSVDALKQRLDQNEMMLIDVRESKEWHEGHVEKAKLIFYGNLGAEIKNLPKDRPLAMMCAVGNRAGLAASLLKREGFAEVYNVLGGMDAWKSRRYPIQKEND